MEKEMGETRKRNAQIWQQRDKQRKAEPEIETEDEGLGVGDRTSRLYPWSTFCPATRHVDKVRDAKR